jgi:hypothetical protein
VTVKVYPSAPQAVTVTIDGRARTVTVHPTSVPGELVPLTPQTRTVHTPMVTPSRSTKVQGQEPTPVIMGLVNGLAFDAGQRVYRNFKIPPTYINSPSFHVHWSKNGNTDQSGRDVLWRIRYHVFNGSSDEVVSAPVHEVDILDTYQDSGTTSRVIYRTEDSPLDGFVAGYYVGMSVEYVAASTTLTVPPVLVSVDLIYDEYAWDAD